MPLVILHQLLNVFVQLANKRGFKQKKECNPLTLLGNGSVKEVTIATNTLANFFNPIFICKL
jgi:hypothetical protein